MSGSGTKWEATGAHEETNLGSQKLFPEVLAEVLVWAIISFLFDTKTDFPYLPVIVAPDYHFF